MVRLFLILFFTFAQIAYSAEQCVIFKGQVLTELKLADILKLPVARPYDYHPDFIVDHSVFKTTEITPEKYNELKEKFVKIDAAKRFKFDRWEAEAFMSKPVDDRGNPFGNFISVMLHDQGKMREIRLDSVYSEMLESGTLEIYTDGKTLIAEILSKQAYSNYISPHRTLVTLK